jgi:hypothetical protein
MGDLLFEGLNVDEGDKDNGAGDLSGSSRLMSFSSAMIEGIQYRGRQRQELGQDHAFRR